MTLATAMLSLWLAAQPLPLSLALGPDDAALSAEDWRKLENGKVLVRVEDVDGSKVKKAVGVAQFESSAKAIFDVLGDYERHAEYMPYVRTARVHARDGQRSTVAYDLDLPWPIGDRHYSVQLIDRPEQVDGMEIWVSRWRYVVGSGNIVDTHGGWQIIPMGTDRSLVRYTVFSDPGGAMPVFARNMATKGAVPKVLKQLRERVKTMTEAAD